MIFSLSLSIVAIVERATPCSFATTACFLPSSSCRRISTFSLSENCFRFFAGGRDELMAAPQHEHRKKSSLTRLRLAESTRRSEKLRPEK
uniref:Secreted protein n=1 Tax=Ixodes ricinus TaxID=34613 RepID=A0A6B0U6Y1_IXORI